MGTNFIDFDTTGVTPATNDTGSSAISPYADSEPATAAVFNRPTDLLRKRTEVLRTEADFQKYLADADRGFVVSGGGTVTWGGATDVVGGTGKFTIGADITIRPFLSPVSSVRASCVIDGPGADTLTLAFSSAGPHAYEGGNDFTVKFVLGGAFGVSVAGTPANDVTVTLVSGTTTAGLVALLNGGTGFITLAGTAPALAFLVASGAGTGNITVISDTPGANTLPASRQKILGALDAERHVVSVTTVSDFFVANTLANGDVLAIWYDKLLDGAGGGRMESLPDYGPGAGVDKTGMVAGDLFKLSSAPQKAPYAIPLCTVVNDNLIFLNQVSVVRGQPQAGLSAGFVQRAGDTMSGPLVISPASGAIPGSGKVLQVTMPGGKTAAEIALSITANSSTGLYIKKGGGGGNGLLLEYGGGTAEAALITSEGVSSVLAISGLNAASTLAALQVDTIAPVAAVLARSSHATGVALEARTSNTLATPASTAAFIEGKRSDTWLKLRQGTASVTTGGVGVDIETPAGSTSDGHALLVTAGSGTGATWPTDPKGAGLKGISSAQAPAVSLQALQAINGALSVWGAADSSGSMVRIGNTIAPTTAGTHDLLRLVVKGYASAAHRGVHISSDTGTDTPLLIETPSNSGVAVDVRGRTSLTAQGNSSTLTVTAESSGGGARAINVAAGHADATQLYLTPRVGMGLGGIGSFGAVYFTPGTGGAANSAARLSGNIGPTVGESGIPFSAAAYFVTPTPVAVSGADSCYYTVGLDGIIHLRANGINMVSGGLSIATGTPVCLTTGTPLPVGLRPLIPTQGTCICISSVGSDPGIAAVFQVDTSGHLWIQHFAGTTKTITFILAVAVDWPLVPIVGL